MIVHRSGDLGIALYIDSDEMASYGWDDISASQARSLAEDALIKLGLRPDSLREIEAYPGVCGGAMVFASLLHDPAWDTAFLAFDNVDDLFSCACAVAATPPAFSDLCYFEKQYILRISDVGANFSRLLYRMLEFGTQLFYPASYGRFLKEHGKVLADFHAIERLSAGVRAASRS